MTYYSHDFFQTELHKKVDIYVSEQFRTPYFGCSRLTYMYMYMCNWTLRSLGRHVLTVQCSVCPLHTVYKEGPRVLEIMLLGGVSV